MLSDLQRALLRALVGETPVETLRRESAALPAEDRALLDRIDPDGFVLSGLLVRKLRFEIICRGDRRMEEWFERAPEDFTAAFRAYVREVPPREYFPRQEAASFHAWCVEKGFVRHPDPS